MKKITLLLFFFALFAQAQTHYFVDKKGKRTVIDDNWFDIEAKRLAYKLPGKTWEKYVKIKNLDKAVMGKAVFKSYKDTQNKKHFASFILAERGNKQLLGLAYTVERSTTRSNGSGYSSIWKEMVLKVVTIDGHHANVLQTLKVTDIPYRREKNQKKEMEMRRKVHNMIKKHFADCQAILDRADSLFNHTWDPGEQNDKLFQLAENPILIKCN